jgi:hypothetical protein
MPISDRGRQKKKKKAGGKKKKTKSPRGPKVLVNVGAG